MFAVHLSCEHLGHSAFDWQSTKKDTRRYTPECRDAQSEGRALVVFCLEWQKTLGLVQ